jgi:hypothetical protein
MKKPSAISHQPSAKIKIQPRAIEALSPVLANSKLKADG